MSSSGTCSHCGKHIEKDIFDHVKWCRRVITESEIAATRKKLAELISTMEPPPNARTVQFVVVERKTTTYKMYVPEGISGDDIDDWFWENVSPEHEETHVIDANLISTHLLSE